MKITLSGLPYAGKGILRSNLAKTLQIEHFSVGDLRRLYATEQGITIEELNERSEVDPIWDIRADEYQKEWAKKTPNFLLEGRLSYHFVPDSIKLFLDVSPGVAAARAMKANRNSEKTYKTIGEQVIANQKRCTSDCLRYFNLYGIQNCYDLNHFDIIIETSKLTPEQVLEEAVKKIKNF